MCILVQFVKLCQILYLNSLTRCITFYDKRKCVYIALRLGSPDKVKFFLKLTRVYYISLFQLLRCVLFCGFDGWFSWLVAAAGGHSDGFSYCDFNAKLCWKALSSRLTNLFSRLLPVWYFFVSLNITQIKKMNVMTKYVTTTAVL